MRCARSVGHATTRFRIDGYYEKMKNGKWKIKLKCSGIERRKDNVIFCTLHRNSNQYFHANDELAGQRARNANVTATRECNQNAFRAYRGAIKKRYRSKTIIKNSREHVVTANAYGSPLSRISHYGTI